MLSHKTPWLASSFISAFITSLGAQALEPVEWFAEPTGDRIVNQERADTVTSERLNVNLTQVFTMPKSGSISSIGIALGGAAATPSVRMSVHHLANGVVDPIPFASKLLENEYFSNIGPQTVPVWIYADFAEHVSIPSGQQIALRIESPFAEIWQTTDDSLSGADFLQAPGTDLAFRVYAVPEPASLRIMVVCCCILLIAKTRRSFLFSLTK